MTKFKYLVVIISFFSFIKIYALEDIKINSESLSPIFDKDIFEYNYYTKEDKIIITVSKNENEIVSGYGVFNIDSDSIFYITSNNSKYKINVYKNYIKKDELNTFKSFYIDNYDIKFNNEVFEYYIDDFNESSLDIKYELNNLSSIVKIENNGDFENGNNDVLITISSSDNKDNSKYVIHVNKSKSVFKEQIKSRELSTIEKDIIIIVLITISLVILFFVFKLLFIKKII